MTSIANRLAQAEAALVKKNPRPLTPSEIERQRVVEHMCRNDFTEAPPDADPELVAIIRQLNDSV